MRIISSQPKTLKTSYDKRRQKAFDLFNKGFVTIVNDEVTEFKVKSQSSDGYYIVMLGESGNGCNCPDYAFNMSALEGDCKHILACIFARRERGFLTMPMQEFTGKNRVYCIRHKIMYEKSEYCSYCESEKTEEWANSNDNEPDEFSP